MEPSPVLGKSPKGTNTSSIICWKGLSLNGTPSSSIFSRGDFLSGLVVFPHRQSVFRRLGFLGQGFCPFRGLRLLGIAAWIISAGVISTWIIYPGLWGTFSYLDEVATSYTQPPIWVVSSTVHSGG